jgi:hypothetical protein
VRKRVAITLAAGGRWPDAGGGLGVCFNWLKIDNRGSNAVDVALSATPTAGDKIDTLFTVGAGKVRCLNVAGPQRAQNAGDPDDWPDAVYLVSASGTTLVLELADHPIVDQVLST